MVTEISTPTTDVEGLGQADLEAIKLRREIHKLDIENESLKHNVGERKSLVIQRWLSAVLPGLSLIGLVIGFVFERNKAIQDHRHERKVQMITTVEDLIGDTAAVGSRDSYSIVSYNESLENVKAVLDTFKNIKDRYRSSLDTAPGAVGNNSPAVAEVFNQAKKDLTTIDKDANTATGLLNTLSSFPAPDKLRHYRDGDSLYTQWLLHPDMPVAGFWSEFGKGNNNEGFKYWQNLQLAAIDYFDKDEATELDEKNYIEAAKVFENWLSTLSTD